MSGVVTEPTVENLKDLWAAEQGLRPPEQVRKVTVSDALVDTGATMLSLPSRLIHQLGLTERRKRRIIGSGGAGEASV
jgi:predicted aspartyl protease